MFKNHPSFIPPSDSTIIWRYMSLSKFLHLLTSSSLYMRHISGFEDSDEGKCTRLDEKVIGRVQGAPYKQEQREPFENLYYVNSWTIGEYDELTFWDKYAPGSTGIAVKSTVHRLKTALYKDKGNDVFIAPVSYINRDEESSFKRYGERICVLEKCFAKGLSYKWENELRLLHIASRDNEQILKMGLSIEIDLPVLIDDIFVSPYAETWYVKVIEDLLRHYGVGNKIVLVSDVLMREEQS